MNGAHDMGGDHGHGPVHQEVDEPTFHAPWEQRAFALTLASGGGRWNLDMSRFARENVPHQDYLRRSYYETWLHGLETLIVDTGMVTVAEIEAAQSGARFEAVETPRFTADRVVPAMQAGGSARIEDSDAESAPRYSVGEQVRVRVDAPETHTRCPRYVRGKSGAIVLDHGVFVFPDTHAHGQGPSPQHVYAVRFEAHELWGDHGDGSPVFVDLWDDYLEPA